MVVEDRPQSLAVRDREMRTRWVRNLGKSLFQQLPDWLGQGIMQPCQVVMSRGIATFRLVADAP